MLRTRFAWRPAPVVTTPDPAPEPASDRIAFGVVTAVWVVCLALLLVFAARAATRLPLLDEHFNVPLLADPFGSWRAYWHQHNEHRIPVPKLLFVAAVKLAGNDFRAPVFMNAVLVAATAAVLARAVAKARGRWAVTDAAVPLAVMNLGQWENLLWGFQIQFFASTLLALMMLALVIGRGFAGSPARVAAAGLVTLLLPLCGANGLALTPAFACFLLYVGVVNLRTGRRLAGGIALAAAAAGLALIPLYFQGLRPPAHHTTARSLPVIAVNAVNFVGLGFGSVGLTVHGPGPGVTAYAAGMMTLLAATAGLLALRLRSPEHRVAAVGIGCVVGGVLCLGLGLAYGRGAMTGVLAANRYTTLAMPLVAAAYIAWAVFPSRPGRWITAGVLAVLIAGSWANAREAFAVGRFWRDKQARTEAEIRAGLPVTFVVDRHVPPAERDYIRAAYLLLRREGFSVFRDLVPDAPLAETPVPVRVVRAEGLEERDGWFRVVGPKPGHLVVALPDRRYVYGLRLDYEAGSPRPIGLVSLVSWDADGSYPPRPGYGIIDNLYPTHGTPADAHVFVDRETDLVRIDLGDPGSALRLHAVTILSCRE
ncbi:MAG: hypothetical protein K2X87_07935 [Gemmataceae bacterium]|nr:hypothetical protein [Gemmataceae bacterium]